MDSHSSREGLKVTMDNPRWIQNEIMSLKGIFPASFWFLSVCECYRWEKHFAAIVSVGQGGMSDTDKSSRDTGFPFSFTRFSYLIYWNLRNNDLRVEIAYGRFTLVLLGQFALNSSIAYSVTLCVSTCKLYWRSETQQLTQTAHLQFKRPMQR